MLAPLRQAARRSLLALSRPLSTASTSAARPASGLEPAFVSLSATAAKAHMTVTPAGHTLLNIPPAEDPLLQYITNSILKHGNRKRAQRIVSRTLLWVHSFTRAPPLDIMREAVKAASPAVRSVTHRHGAKNVARPIALSEKQRTRFAVQWILQSSKSRSGQTMEERLAREFIAVLQGESGVLDKKREVHRFAMVNRGNAETRT